MDWMLTSRRMLSWRYSCTTGWGEDRENTAQVGALELAVLYGEDGDLTPQDDQHSARCDRLDEEDWLGMGLLEDQYLCAVKDSAVGGVLQV